jgi:hypothetical protein
MRALAVAGLKEALKIVAEVIVETLQSAGVKRCYGVVGIPSIMSPTPCGAALSDGSTYGTRKSAVSLRGRRRCSPVI